MCFFWLADNALNATARRRLTRPFLMGGFCGGLTTLSSVAVDAAQSLRSGPELGDVLFLTTVVCVAVASVAIGRIAVRALDGGRS